jgi:hypothetical protein
MPSDLGLCLFLAFSWRLVGGDVCSTFARQSESSRSGPVGVPAEALPMTSRNVRSVEQMPRKLLNLSFRPLSTHPDRTSPLVPADLIRASEHVGQR